MFLLLFNVHYWIYTFTLVDFWFNLCLFFSRFIHCVYTFLLPLDLLNHFQIIFFCSNNVSDSVWLCTIFLKIVFQSVTLLLLLLLYTLKQIYMNLFWVCARQQGGRRRKTEEGKASEGGGEEWGGWIHRVTTVWRLLLTVADGVWRPNCSYSVWEGIV